MKACLSCGQPLAETDTVCPRCGTVLTAADLPGQGTQYPGGTPTGQGAAPVYPGNPGPSGAVTQGMPFDAFLPLVKDQTPLKLYFAAGVVAVVTAVAAILLGIFADFVGFVDFLVYLIFGLFLLIGKKKSKTYLLIPLIYTAVASVAHFIFSGIPVGIVFLVVGIIAFVRFSRLERAFEEFQRTGNLP